MNKHQKDTIKLVNEAYYKLSTLNNIKYHYFNKRIHIHTHQMINYFPRIEVGTVRALHYYTARMLYFKESCLQKSSLS